MCVFGWVVGVGLSDRWQSTISNKHQVTPDRDWWYERVNWRGAWRYHRNRECGCIWNQERSACTHKNLHLSYPAHGCHPTHHVWKDRQLWDRSRRCLQMTFTDACSCAHTHTHETTTSTNPWSLEVVPLVYGALCQVGCFFNSSSFCVFRRPLKDDQAAQDQSKQRHRWGIGMQLKSTSSKNMIQKNLQRFRQRARRDRKKGVIQ